MDCHHPPQANNTYLPQLYNNIGDSFRLEHPVRGSKTYSPLYNTPCDHTPGLRRCSTRGDCKFLFRIVVNNKTVQKTFKSLKNCSVSFVFPVSPAVPLEKKLQHTRCATPYNCPNPFAPSPPPWLYTSARSPDHPFPKISRHLSIRRTAQGERLRFTPKYSGVILNTTSCDF